MPKQEVSAHQPLAGEPAAEPRTQVAPLAELVPLLLAVDRPQVEMPAEAEAAALYLAPGGAGHACRALYPAVGAAGCQAPTTRLLLLQLLVLLLQLLRPPCHASAPCPWTTAPRCPPPRSSACRWTSWPSRRRPRRRQGGWCPRAACVGHAFWCRKCMLSLRRVPKRAGEWLGFRHRKQVDRGMRPARDGKGYAMTTCMGMRTLAGLREGLPYVRCRCGHQGQGRGLGLEVLQWWSHKPRLEVGHVACTYAALPWPWCQAPVAVGSKSRGPALPADWRVKVQRPASTCSEPPASTFWECKNC